VTFGAGCSNTTLAVTGPAAALSAYASFSVPTAGADGELRFGLSPALALTLAPTSSSANYALFCAPAASASTSYKGISFAVTAHASSSAFYLGGYFGQCPPGVVRNTALTGCTGWTAVTLTLPLDTAPSLPRSVRRTGAV
jgi:hypothetical protein